MSSQVNNKLIITGAEGQLGNAFKEIAPLFPEFNFLFFGRKDLDITDRNAVNTVMTATKPFACINCAAYTAVDKAESHREQALLVNETGAGAVAAACKANAVIFIHFSTDYVFNGLGDTPYKVADQTDPVNFYGETKLRGEHAALKENHAAVIIRTSWLYGNYGNNFVKTMLRLMKEKERIGVVNDQHGSPTYTADLALTVMQIIKTGKITPGIYHYANAGETTWYDFANEIKTLTGSECIVDPISTAGYPTPAARPAYSVLDSSNIQQVYNAVIPGWQASLRKCLDKLAD